jgi:hypothetical protein
MKPQIRIINSSNLVRAGRSVSGQALAEYVLIAAVLLALAIAADRIFAGALGSYFNRVAFMRLGLAGIAP